MEIKLHLGCGKRYLPGWIHIDLADFPHIDYRQSVADLSNFKTDSVDEIYACNLLEHFDRHEVPRVLTEWARVLKLPRKSEVQEIHKNRVAKRGAYCVSRCRILKQRWSIILNIEMLLFSKAIS